MVDLDNNQQQSLRTNRRGFMAAVVGAGIYAAARLPKYLDGLPKQSFDKALSEVDPELRRSLLTPKGFNERVTGLIEALNGSRNNRPNEFFARGVARMREHGIKFELFEVDKNKAFWFNQESKVLFINSARIEALRSDAPSRGASGAALAVVAGAFVELELSLDQDHYVTFAMNQRGVDFVEDLRSLMTRLAEGKVIHNFSEKGWSNVHQVPRSKFREDIDGRFVANDSIFEQLLERYPFKNDDL
ncbi:MAG: hypothetical protein ACK5Y6_05090, partial [Pseudomonadota bacterium]